MLLCTGLAVGLAAAEMTDAEWAQLKRDYLAKPRRIMVDDDGCDAVNFPKNKAATIENFYAEMLDKMPGNEFDVLVYCPGTVGFSVLNRTAFGDRQLGTPFPDNLKNITRTLDEEFDTDPLELARQFARRHNYEFVINMRANDIHDASYKAWLPQWKIDNPQFLCGSEKQRPMYGWWTSYDFAHKEVRDRFSAYIKEWIDNYDPDGIMIDYYRSPMLFKSAALGNEVSQREMDDYTGMIRELRNYAETAGRKRGRPIYFAFRLPDSPIACRAIGVDVERWAREGLFDIFIAAGDAGRLRPWRETAEFCKRHNLKFYASIDSSFLKARDLYNRNSVAAFNGDCAAAWQGGAEGIYFFNMFYQTHYFPHIRRNAEELAQCSKVYFVTRYGGAPFPLHSENRDPFLKLLYPANATYMIPGSRNEVIVEIGDDFTKPGSEQAVATLFLHTATPVDQLKVAINGKLLSDGVNRKDNAVYNVPLELLKPGENTVSLEFIGSEDSNARERIIMAGDRLLSGANQPPWRRLFPGNAGKGTEQIVDGAYKLTSLGDGAVNFFYPMAGVAGGELNATFELRVEPGSAPGTSVFRLANNVSVEEVDFRPGEIACKFSGKSVKFDTTDRFHVYRVKLNDRQLEVEADGKTLIKTTLKANAHDRNTRMTGFHYSVPDMQSSGILFGGLSSDGRGAGYWKNLRLKSNSAVINDLALEVKFPEKFDKKMTELGTTTPKWDFDLDFSNGSAPQVPGLVNGYSKLSAAPGGGTVLDHDLNNGASMNINASVPARRKNRSMIVDWEVAELRSPKQNGDQSFQMLLRPRYLNGTGHYEFMIRSVDGEVVTSWGKVLVPPGPQKLRAVIDATTGQAAVFLDGKPLTSGKVGTQNYGSGVTWGDISSTISGATNLKYVRIASEPAEDMAELRTLVPEKWDFAIDFSEGKVPAQPGFKNEFRQVAPAESGKGVLLDNDIGGGYDSMNTFNHPTAKIADAEYFVAEWAVKPVRKPIKPKEIASFQMVMRPLVYGGNGKHWEFVVRSAVDEVLTPWGKFATSGTQNLRATLNLATGEAEVFLDGKLIDVGVLKQASYQPGMVWGDVSVVVGGASELEYVRCAYIR